MQTGKKLKHPDEGKAKKIITDRPRLNITALVYLPEAEVIWSGSSDGTIRVWSLKVCHLSLTSFSFLF